MKMLVTFKNHKEYRRYVFDYIECIDGYFNIYQYCKKIHKIKVPNEFIVCSFKVGIDYEKH